MSYEKGFNDFVPSKEDWLAAAASYEEGSEDPGIAASHREYRRRAAKNCRNKAAQIELEQIWRIA